MGKLLPRVFYSAVGGLPLLCLAFVLSCVWVEPLSVEGGGWVRAGATLVLLEFLLLHSGAFMAAGPIAFPKWWQRLAWFTGFGLVYGVALVGFADWSGSDYVLWVLVGVVGSRLATLVIWKDKRGTILMLQRSALGIIILLLTAIVCVLPLPDLGITEAVREGAFGTSVDDLLSRHPERFIAWGVTYFLFMGLAELSAGWYMPDWTDQQVDDAWKALSSK